MRVLVILMQSRLGAHDVATVDLVARTQAVRGDARPWRGGSKISGGQGKNAQISGSHCNRDDGELKSWEW